MEMVDYITAGIFVIDENLTISYWNKWLVMHTGIKEESAIGATFDSLFSYVNVPTLKRKIKTTLSLNTNTFYNPPDGYLIKIKNERVIETPLEYAYQTIKIVPYDVEKKLALIIIDDQTAIKEAYLKLERLKNKAQGYLDIIDEHVCTMITDESGKILTASSALCKLSGYPQDELLGKNPRVFKHPATKASMYKHLWSTIKNGAVWRGEYRNLKKDGSEYWVRSTIFTVPNNSAVEYQAIIEDVTDKKKIENISITDELTGLYNRRHFNAMFAMDLQKSKVAKDKFAFVMFDVDHFKGYNDTYGHQKGDVVLTSVAKAIKGVSSDKGEAFRLGGEEFGCLFVGMTHAQVASIAEEIRASIEGMGIENIRNSASAFVTASLGVYYLDFTKEKNMDEIDARAIYARADEGLYKAKASGRNRVVFWTPEIGAESNAH